MGTTTAPARGRSADGPADFRLAVADLSGSGLRSGAEIAELPAPKRLAPWSYAVSVTVYEPGGDEVASGRLVLLHDPAGVEAWDGTFRVVVFGTCEVTPDMAHDPMLAGAAWSWLTEQLAAHGAQYAALGGTVTTTTSTRFGDIAGPPCVEELELRASWTAATPQMSAHLSAFTEFLAVSAGLPPDGVSTLADDRHPFARKSS